ncbi:MAG: YWFCY domain-containing protein, partial [Prevotella sp.]|nr:YWFCY domain-containing protein [Prevotella sp.]
MSISNSPPFGGVGGGYKNSIMAQEDDLRALGKVMDFMRGISVIFLLIN